VNKNNEYRYLKIIHTSTNASFEIKYGYGNITSLILDIRLNNIYVLISLILDIRLNNIYVLISLILDNKIK
jgi:hypothetical protein